MSDFFRIITKKWATFSGLLQKNERLWGFINEKWKNVFN